MASVDKRKLPGKPAMDGGNRKSPAIAKKVPLAPDFKTTYGAGDGAGGGSVPAMDGGNRKNPAIAGKLPMPPNHDSYNQGAK